MHRFVPTYFIFINSSDSSPSLLCRLSYEWNHCVRALIPLFSVLHCFFFMVDLSMVYSKFNQLYAGIFICFSSVLFLFDQLFVSFDYLNALTFSSVVLDIRIICNCDFFDQLCLIFDQLSVFFDQL